MKRYGGALPITLAVAGLALAVALVVPATARQQPQPHPVPIEPFAGKVVYVVTRTEDSEGDPLTGVYQNARTVQLGDRHFFVGEVVPLDDSPAYKVAAGKRVWTPVSEIVQMTEFDSPKEALEFFETAYDEPGSAPTLHDPGRRSS
jgi:hypothetical protein